MSSSTPDPEKGVRPSDSRPDPSRALSLTSVLSQRFIASPKSVDEEDEDFSNKVSPEQLATIDPTLPSNDHLAIFRRLTGIESGVAHKKRALKRPAANQGIYQHVVEEETAAKRKYRFFSRLINFCLGLQIVVAAALTALGAGDGPHAVVTVFGAINTVIAGFLTYLKGSGLPNRTKFFQNEWSRLRDHIEQQERLFGCEGHGLDVYEEVKRVETMYKDIRAEIEANTPEGYTSVTSTRGREQTLKTTNTALTNTASTNMASTKPVASETGGNFPSGLYHNSRLSTVNSMKP